MTSAQRVVIVDIPGRPITQQRAAAEAVHPASRRAADAAQQLGLFAPRPSAPPQVDAPALRCPLRG
jgi:hypothetical protein